MRIELLTFGVLREAGLAGPLEVGAGTTVAGLLAQVSARLTDDRLRGLLPKCAVSVNEEYARGPLELREGDMVGILPPVSGGSGRGIETYLTRERIDVAALAEAAKAGEDGAVVVFDGIVRNNTRGRATLHLDYEAYEAMAEKQMAALTAEALERFAVRQVTLVHRLGRLMVGETSVAIVVASAHRGAAFDACRWVIDTLKRTVPVWKRETFADGVVWADGEPFPEELTAGEGGTA